MSGFRAIARGCAGALLLAACTSTPDVYNAGTKREFTAAQIAGCPDHPFKPEFQDIKKTAAQPSEKFDLEIYNYQGEPIRTMIITITGGGGLPTQSLLWDFKDDAGKQVNSGYYFWVVTPHSTGEEQVTCTFYVNPKDNDKLK